MRSLVFDRSLYFVHESVRNKQSELMTKIFGRWGGVDGVQ